MPKTAVSEFLEAELVQDQDVELPPSEEVLRIFARPGSIPDAQVQTARVLVLSSHGGTRQDWTILLVEDRHNIWNVPGGRKEACDDPLEVTALRELCEKTGLCDVHLEFCLQKRSSGSGNNRQII